MVGVTHNALDAVSCFGTFAPSEPLCRDASQGMLRWFTGPVELLAVLCGESFSITLNREVSSCSICRTCLLSFGGVRVVPS